MKKLFKLLACVLCITMLINVPVYAAETDSAPILIASNPMAASVTGTVVEVQKYGNLTMSTTPAEFAKAGFAYGDILTVTVGDNTLDIPLGSSYSDVDTGSLIVRMTEDQVIVAINMGNFATTYNVEVNATVKFALKEKEGYLSEYLLRQLTRTNERSDYASDEIFANFRPITTTGLKAGIIYRSASPINNEIGRAAYADKLSKAAGVQTFVNLADAKENIAGYRAADDFNSPYYAGKFDQGQVITLNMGVDLKSEDFGKKLVEGLNFIATHEAPYLIHCTEGKDRAGFTAAVIEALMGASADEIIEDYMVTYCNYYGLEKGSEQYEAVAKSNIQASLATIICGLDKDADLSKVNLAKACKKYLKSLGMTSKEIKALKTALSADAPKAIAGSYTVKAGDTLWKIADAHLGDGSRFPEIVKLNKDKITNPDVILIGWELILPE